jgi:hypothetical protein
MLYTYDQIKVVHLEMTDACNAACPMCARNINGGEDNPQLPNTELSIDDIKKIFEPRFIQQLDRLYMCGNYGDPIAAKHTLEAFEYFRSNNNKINLSMHTNASAKRPEWWAELAQVMGRKGYVVFSIDGLEDTNHLYRQNTIWSKIMANAEAFISAGGRARWDYIVFAHNEHQVEEAEALANKMGFEKFQYKKSARFFSNVSGVTKEIHQAINRKGAHTALLAAPKNPKYRNSVIDEISKFAKEEEQVKIIPSKIEDIELFPQTFYNDPNKKKPVEKVWDEAVIKCKVAEEKSLLLEKICNKTIKSVETHIKYVKNIFENNNLGISLKSSNKVISYFDTINKNFTELSFLMGKSNKKKILSPNFTKNLFVYELVRIYS